MEAAVNNREVFFQSVTGINFLGQIVELIPELPLPPDCGAQEQQAILWGCELATAYLSTQACEGDCVELFHEPSMVLYDSMHHQGILAVPSFRRTFYLPRSL